MKGFKVAPYMVGAIILLLLAVTFIWGFWSGALAGRTQEEDGETEIEGCRKDEDCINNIDGSKCIMVYPGSFSLFCGCVTNEDCENKRSGVCGSENKCT